MLTWLLWVPCSDNADEGAHAKIGDISKYQFNYLFWTVVTIEISWTKIKHQNQFPHLLLQCRLVGIADWPVLHNIIFFGQINKYSTWGHSILHKVSFMLLSIDIEFIFCIWCRTGWWPACTVLLKISGTLNICTVYTIYLVLISIRLLTHKWRQSKRKWLIQNGQVFDMWLGSTT